MALYSAIAISGDDIQDTGCTPLLKKATNTPRNSERGRNIFSIIITTLAIHQYPMNGKMSYTIFCTSPAYRVLVIANYMYTYTLHMQ